MQAPSLDSSGELDPAEHEVGDLEPIVAGVAHDFGNILAVITNYVSLASRRLDDPTTAELLDKVRIAAQRAARLNRQLHDLGECGSLSAQRLPVNDVIRGAQPLLAEGLRDGYGLRLDLADDPLEAQASRNGLEMALRHLVDNACDAMPDGGDVKIGTRRVDDACGSVEVTVSDDGVGMPPDVVAHAIEPRYSTHPKGQTSGLGLTIVDRVVRTLGGQVWIESVEGAGTTVRLRLAGEGARG
jgi:signal transduction histidine kinase